MSYRPSDLLRGRAIPDAVLRELPKTDLHVNLDGSLRPATRDELGGGPTRPLLQTADNLDRVAAELVEDATACGVRVVEVRFSPLQHGEGGLTPEAALTAVDAGLTRAATETGVKTGIILTGLRTIEPEQSLELARLAVSWKGRGVVAFDIPGAGEIHREAFYHVMNNNLPATCLAGEEYGPESIHTAIHRCGAKRIGHGTRLEEDPQLMAFVGDHRIPLEICLTSNVRSGVVATAGDHPLRRYHEAGLRVCLNTDNTLLNDTDMVRELRFAVDTFDFTLLQLEDIVLGGFKSAFLPEQEAHLLMRDVLAEFRRIRDAHALDDLVATGGVA